MTAKVKQRIITLRPKGLAVAASTLPIGWITQERKIRVTRDTIEAWYGAPLDNHDCPVLMWPKFAWEEVHVG